MDTTESIDEPDDEDPTAKVYFYCTLAMSILSIIGTLIIIITYWYFDDMRSTGREILLYLSIADFLTAVGNIIGISWYETKHMMDESVCEPLCETHASLTIFSSISSYFWTVSMAVHLFTGLVLRKPWREKSLIIFHIMCWGFPASIAVIVLSADVIGHDASYVPSWCWIDPDVAHPIMWQYLSGKLWEILAFVIILALYTAIKSTLWKQIRSTKVSNSYATQANKMQHKKRNRLSDASRKLTFVPVVFLLCRMWGTIRFIKNNHFESGNETWIVLLQGIGDSAQGFANCVLYIIFTETLRKRMVLCLFPCCRNTSRVHIEVEADSKSGQGRSKSSVPMTIVSVTGN